MLNAAQTGAVLFGEDGIVSHLKTGAVVLSCATVPPAFAIGEEDDAAVAKVYARNAGLELPGKK